MPFYDKKALKNLPQASAITEFPQKTIFFACDAHLDQAPWLKKLETIDWLVDGDADILVDLGQLRLEIVEFGNNLIHENED